MATGVVSGLVALMLEANEYAACGPQAAGTTHLASSPNAVKAMLQYSATPLRDAAGKPYDVLTQGSGLVNGVGAIWLAYTANTSKRAGSFWLDGRRAALDALRRCDRGVVGDVDLGHAHRCAAAA